jgi:hypothetical protein
MIPLPVVCKVKAENLVKTFRLASPTCKARAIEGDEQRRSWLFQQSERVIPSCRMRVCVTVSHVLYVARVN